MDPGEPYRRRKKQVGRGVEASQCCGVHAGRLGWMNSSPVGTKRCCPPRNRVTSWPGPHGRVGRPHWDPSAMALLPLRLCLPLTLHPIAGRAWSGCARAVPRWPVSASRWDFNVEPLQAGNLRPYGEYPPYRYYVSLSVPRSGLMPCCTPAWRSGWADRRGERVGSERLKMGW